MTTQPNPMRCLLLCFSPTDREGKDALAKQLAPLETFCNLLLWSVDDIPIGGNLAGEFATVAARADVALLLLSPDLLVEPAAAMQLEVLRHEQEQRDLRLVPVLWRECLWHTVDWLAKLKPVPAHGSALKSLDRPRRESALRDFGRQLAMLPMAQATVEVASPPVLPATSPYRRQKRPVGLWVVATLGVMATVGGAGAALWHFSHGRQSNPSSAAAGRGVAAVAPVAGGFPSTLDVGSDNDIQAKSGSQVRAGLFGVAKGPSPGSIGSRNHIVAGPNSVVEVGIDLSPHPSHPHPRKP